MSKPLIDLLDQLEGEEGPVNGAVIVLREKEHTGVHAAFLLKRQADTWSELSHTTHMPSVVALLRGYIQKGAGIVDMSFDFKKGHAHKSRFSSAIVILLRDTSAPPMTFGDTKDTLILVDLQTQERILKEGEHVVDAVKLYIQGVTRANDLATHTAALYTPRRGGRSGGRRYLLEYHLALSEGYPITPQMLVVLNATDVIDKKGIPPSIDAIALQIKGEFERFFADQSRVDRLVKSNGLGAFCNEAFIPLHKDPNNLSPACWEFVVAADNRSLEWRTLGRLLLHASLRNNTCGLTLDQILVEIDQTKAGFAALLPLRKDLIRTLLDDAVQLGFLVNRTHRSRVLVNDYDDVYTLNFKHELVMEILNAQSDAQSETQWEGPGEISHTEAYILEAVGYQPSSFQMIKDKVYEEETRRGIQPYTTQGLRGALGKLEKRGLIVNSYKESAPLRKRYTRDGEDKTQRDSCDQPAVCRQEGGTCWWHAVNELLERSSLRKQLHTAVRDQMYTCPLESSCADLPANVPGERHMWYTTTKESMDPQTLSKKGFKELGNSEVGTEGGKWELLLYNLLHRYSDLRVGWKSLKRHPNQRLTLSWRDSFTGKESRWDRTDDEKDIILAKLPLIRGDGLSGFDPVSSQSSDGPVVLSVAKQIVFAAEKNMSRYYTILGGVINSPNHAVAFDFCENKTGIMLCNYGSCRTANGIRGEDAGEEKDMKLVKEIYILLQPRRDGAKSDNTQKRQHVLYTLCPSSVAPIMKYHEALQEGRLSSEVLVILNAIAIVERAGRSPTMKTITHAIEYEREHLERMLFLHEEDRLTDLLDSLIAMDILRNPQRFGEDMQDTYIPSTFFEEPDLEEPDLEEPDLEAPDLGKLGSWYKLGEKVHDFLTSENEGDTNNRLYEAVARLLLHAVLRNEKNARRAAGSSSVWLLVDEFTGELGIMLEGLFSLAHQDGRIRQSRLKANLKLAQELGLLQIQK